VVVMWVPLRFAAPDFRGITKLGSAPFA